MNARDRSRLSSLGGKARRRKRVITPLSVRIERSNRASRLNSMNETAMRKVRIANPRAYCELGTNGNGIHFIVFAPAGVLGEGKTPRAAWEDALTNALAEAVTA